jgi:threonylcarbamoyladenosine tRNA methylthiotransferase CDKAL1
MKVYIETYGCTANKNDETIIKGILKQNQYNIVDEITDADILILLTCTVIGTTEQRMISRLKQFNKTKKKIIIAGCMPSVQAELLKKTSPFAQLLDVNHIQYIDEVIKGKQIPPIQDLNTTIPKCFSGISAPISIAKGCLFNCTYCITHLARGKLVSFPKEQILKDIQQALNQGCKEIFLTAQDTASYGFGTNDSLANLLQSVCRISGDFRVRVGMMNPFTAQKNIDSILSAYANLKMYKFVHLPVQSGNDQILKQMNRHYTKNEYIDIIDQFKNAFNNITISTDIIVGYPGETNTQFNDSIELIKKIQPDMVNITRFSPRPFTKAKTMKDKVPTDIAKKRSQTISFLCQKISTTKNQNHIGATYSVLVVKKYKGKSIGRTDNYKPVLLQEDIDIGKRVNVKIVDVSSIHLVGKLI